MLSENEYKLQINLNTRTFLPLLILFALIWWQNHHRTNRLGHQNFKKL